MAKLKKLKRSDEHKDFTEIEQLFAERKEALELFFVVHSFGHSEKEVKEKKKYLDYQLQEAEYDASLALLGAIEAAFRLDFDYRHTQRLKDARSKAIRGMTELTRDVFSSKVPMSKLFELLSIDHSAPGRTINLLHIFFQYRNWLAHGRYWQLKLKIGRPTFSDIYQVAQAIKNILQN